MGKANGTESWKVRRYTTDLLDIPGVAFHVDVDDPKERIQKYIDMYRDKPGEEKQQVRYSTIPPLSSQCVNDH